MDTFAPAPVPKSLPRRSNRNPPENGLFSEARADDHREHQSGECSPVSYHVMVGGIDFGGAQQRHHNRLHQEFKRAAENDADSQTSKPTPRPHVADIAPWRVRSPSPQKHQKAAERFNSRRQDDDENREKPQRSKSAQLRGDGIVGRRCGPRFGPEV